MTSSTTRQCSGPLLTTKLTNYTVVDKIIITLVFSEAKNGFKSVICIFCCSVSVGNIHLVINCNNPVRLKPFLAAENTSVIIILATTADR